MRENTEKQSFLAEQWAVCKAFLTYIRFQDLWSALYSIIFVVTASLWFGRIPKMPIAFLVCLPFIYLSVLVTILLFLGALRDRYIGTPSHDLLLRLFGPEGSLAGYLKRDGARMLRAAFAVGVYLFLGLLHLALGPDKNELGWLLMPCVFIGMAAIFSLNERGVRLSGRDEESGDAACKRSFRSMMLHRSIYMVLLVITMYIMVRFLVLPLRHMFMGG